MKTKKNFIAPTYLKIFIVLPVIAVMLIVYSSCGKNKKSEAISTELAPPPPPPPPPVSGLSDSTYVNVDELPVFTGGEAGLYKYIGKNTIYPAEAKKNNIQGKVLVKFIVQKDGSISHASVVKEVNPLLDAEAVRVVSSLPKFEKPGKKNGETVSVYYVIPIAFTLK